MGFGVDLEQLGVVREGPLRDSVEVPGHEGVHDRLQRGEEGRHRRQRRVHPVARDGRGRASPQRRWVAGRGHGSGLRCWVMGENVAIWKSKHYS